MSITDNGGEFEFLNTTTPPAIIEDLNDNTTSSFVPVAVLPDGGYGVASLIDSFVSIHHTGWEYPTVYKLDADGKIVWRTPILDTFSRDLVQLYPTLNGDIIGLGYDYFILTDPDSIDNAYRGSFIFRLDGEDGHLLWERKILDTCLTDFRGSFIDGVELQDGSLIFTGLILSGPLPGDTIFVDNPDVWLIRLSADGCFAPNCGKIQLYFKTVSGTIEPLVQQLELWPNPASHWLEVGWQQVLELSGGLQWAVLDMQGRLLDRGRLTQSLRALRLDVSDYVPGTYVLQLQDRSGRIAAVGQWIKIAP